MSQRNFLKPIILQIVCLRTSLCYGQFAWSKRDQNSQKLALHLIRTPPSYTQTPLISIPLVSLLVGSTRTAASFIADFFLREKEFHAVFHAIQNEVILVCYNCGKGSHKEDQFHTKEVWVLGIFGSQINYSSLISWNFFYITIHYA